jgi:hypothetical protein
MQVPDLFDPLPRPKPYGDDGFIYVVEKTYERTQPQKQLIELIFEKGTSSRERARSENEYAVYSIKHCHRLELLVESQQTIPTHHA